MGSIVAYTLQYPHHTHPLDMKSLLLVSTLLGCVYGHGRLMDPPSRASMWRVGFNTPPDYDDNQGFCGGFAIQWGHNDGKCGLCGDNWANEIRDHETPNKYGNGIITAVYEPNEVIEIQVDVTANHKGYFTFRLCAADDDLTDPTQECMDSNVLKVVPEMSEKYVLPSTMTGLYNTSVQLPNIECDRCVLQWTYTAGNNWGWCDDDQKYGEVGCGPQETFRACSDIAIKSGANRNLSPRFPKPVKQTGGYTKNRIPISADAKTSPAPVCRGLREGLTGWCEANCHHNPPHCPAELCQCESTYKV